MLSEAATRVAHIHSCPRTKLMPSRSSRRTERSPSAPGCERTRSAAMQAALKANVPASIRNALPVPTAATTKPPSAGPSRRAQVWRTSWSSELASTSWSAGTTSGTSAPKAGPKKASPAPNSTTRQTRCQISSTPVSESTPMATSTAARTRSAPISTRRRSIRSLTIPPVSRNATMPSVHDSPTSDSATGSLSMS